MGAPIKCPACNGTGRASFNVNYVCLVCAGTGKLYDEHDDTKGLDALKEIFNIK